MNKITQLEKEILTARKENNTVAKNLLMTLKGEYQNAIKNGQAETDETLEKLIRKFVKNAELIGNETSKIEIEILNGYLPKQLSETEVREIVIAKLTANIEKVEAYKSGNKGSIGFFMGSITKETSGNAEPKMINKILIEELEK
jgi:aspartyl-tRNA(Asn)/glutamyl-tRNA(Gln) amidotransferase subunit B